MSLRRCVCFGCIISNLLLCVPWIHIHNIFFALLQTGKLVLNHADERALGLHSLRFSEVDRSVDSSVFLFRWKDLIRLDQCCERSCRLLRKYLPICYQAYCASTSLTYLNTTSSTQIFRYVIKYSILKVVLILNLKLTWIFLHNQITKWSDSYLT